AQSAWKEPICYLDGLPRYYSLQHLSLGFGSAAGFAESAPKKRLMPWNPDTYNKFQRERSAPFADLLALVHVRDNLRVIDLGCGTGELTRQLADYLPASDVLGIDNSPQMLSRAAEHARPGLRFEPASIEELGGEYDLIFSHAAIHWVPDHFALIPRLL